MSQKALNIAKRQNLVPGEILFLDGTQDSSEKLMRRAAWGSKKSWKQRNGK